MILMIYRIMNKHSCWCGFAIRANIFRQTFHLTLTGFQTLLGFRSESAVIAGLTRNPLKHLILILLLTSCISDYTPVGVADTAGILVVEGMIVVNGQTTIKLSRTVKLYDKFPKNAVYVQNANIQLIDEENRIIAVARQQTVAGMPVPGMYEINDEIFFMPGMKYALDIRIGNSHYRSAFIESVHTPEIDEVSWNVNEDNSMDIMVSTHDPANQTKYFLWRFEEDWEITAPLRAVYRYDPDTKKVVESDRYRCWNSDKSKSLLLGASDRLSETVIINKKIHYIQPNDPRFCSLYSILVKQYGLDREAYDFFDKLQQHVDQSGSLFAPQPSEKEGNIQCLSNPDEPVIGYMAIAREVTHRLYIDIEQLNLFYLFRHYECETTPWDNVPNIFIPNIDYAYAIGLGIYEVTGPGSYRCSPIRCVDCTVSGGTKNKPDFWPNHNK